MKRLAGMLTVMHKELGLYFNSPIAYIFLFVFVTLLGFLYMAQFFLVSQADMRIFFDVLPMVLCVFLPAVTMRLWADEKSSGTYELLLTLPLRPHDLVLGKFVASFLFYAIALAATVPIPIMLLAIGRPDLGPIIGAYIGAYCLGALFLSVGMFVSGLCRDQIVAFIVSMLSCFLLVLLGTEFIAATVDGWIPGLGGLLLNHVGVTKHMASFSKGVVALRDLVYFGVGTGALLWLNACWIEGRLRPRQTQLFATVAGIAASIVLVANMLCSAIGLGRVDLTAERMYTVSPVTRDILGSLKTPVTIKYYVSPQEKMPTGFKTLERDVLDKLDEFRLASRGKLQFKVFHMEAANVTQGDTESLEASLQRKGVQPFQVQSIEADELGVRLIYSSMAIAYKEKPEEMLPRVIPSNIDELEYLLISRIYRLTLPRSPTVAIVAPRQERSVDPQLRALMQQLGQALPEHMADDPYALVPLLLEYEGYRTQRITLTDDDPIPGDVDTLVLLEPQHLTQPQHQAIATFLSAGGSVLLAAQQYEYQYSPSAYGAVSAIPRLLQPNVNPLLERWGVTLDDQVLLDANNDALSIGGGMRMGPFALSVPIKLPTHIRLTPEGMNQERSLTARLSSILYLWGSALHVDESRLRAEGLEADVLLWSSPVSWTIPESQVRTLAPNMRPAYRDALGPFPLAVWIEGQFANPFASTRTGTVRAAPGKLLVMGAATPFRENLMEHGGHMHLLLNAVDALSLEADLTQIRSKQPFDRSIGHVSSAAKAGWRFFVSLLMPLVIAGIGWFRMLLRARTKRQYVQLLQSTA